jgi:CO/xanthine dehydrogenase FAD-binding subunit
MCNCIEEYNARMRAKLDSTTVQIATKFDHNGDERVVISGVYKKVNRAGQLCKAWTHFDIQAKFCPFCGKKY